MHAPGSKRQTREVKVGLMGGVHYCSVGICNTDGLGSDTLVDDGGGHGAKVRCAAVVGNGKSIRRGW